MDKHNDKILNYLEKIEENYSRHYTPTDIIIAICTFTYSDELIKKKIEEFDIDFSRLEIAILNLLISKKYSYFNILVKIYDIDQILLVNKHAKKLLKISNNNFELFEIIIKFIDPDIIKEYIQEIWYINDYKSLNNFEKSNKLDFLLFITSEQVVFAFAEKHFELLNKYIQISANLIKPNLKNFINLSLGVDDGDYLVWLLNNIPETMEYYFNIISYINKNNYKNFKYFKLLCGYNSLKILLS